MSDNPQNADTTQSGDTQPLTFTSTGKAARVRDALYAAAVALTQAVCDVRALIDLKGVAIKLDDSGMQLVEPVTDDSTDEEKRLSQAWYEFDQIANELGVVVELHLAASDPIPKTPHAAVVQLAEAQRVYENTADEHLRNFVEWQKLEAQQGRTRERVVDRLMYPSGRMFDDVNEATPAMSRSAAEKAASGDPEYVQLRDALAEASSNMKGTEIALEVQRQKVETSREILRTIVGAKASQAPIVLNVDVPQGVDPSFTRRGPQH